MSSVASQQQWGDESRTAGDRCEWTYSHIRQDRIHGEAWLIRFRPVPERAFALRFGSRIDGEWQ